MRIKLLIALMLLLSCSAFAGQKRSCAVFTFKPCKGLKNGQIGSIGNKYAILLSKSGKFDVLPRYQMNRELMTKRFNYQKYKSDLSITVAAGKALNLDFAINCVFEYKDGTYWFTSSLVDIEQGKALKTIRSFYKGDSDDFVKLAPASNMANLFPSITVESEKVVQGNRQPQTTQAARDAAEARRRQAVAEAEAARRWDAETAKRLEAKKPVNPNAEKKNNARLLAELEEQLRKEKEDARIQEAQPTPRTPKHEPIANTIATEPAVTKADPASTGGIDEAEKWAKWAEDGDAEELADIPGLDLVETEPAANKNEDEWIKWAEEATKELGPIETSNTKTTPPTSVKKTEPPISRKQPIRGSRPKQSPAIKRVPERVKQVRRRDDSRETARPKRKGSFTDHLTVGSRATFFFMLDGSSSSPILGSAQSLEAKQSFIPWKIYVDWKLSHYFSVEGTFERMVVEADSAEITLTGPIFSLFFHPHTKSLWKPEIGLGATFFNASIDENGDNLDNSIGLAFTGGLERNISNNWTADALLRYTLLNINNYAGGEESVSFSNIALGFGLGYSF